MKSEYFACIHNYSTSSKINKMAEIGWFDGILDYLSGGSWYFEDCVCGDRHWWKRRGRVICIYIEF